MEEERIDEEQEIESVKKDRRRVSAVGVVEIVLILVEKNQRQRTLYL